MPLVGSLEVEEIIHAVSSCKRLVSLTRLANHQSKDPSLEGIFLLKWRKKENRDDGSLQEKLKDLQTKELRGVTLVRFYYPIQMHTRGKRSTVADAL